MKIEGKPKPVDVVVKDNALVHASYIMERQEKMLMYFVVWAYQEKRSQHLTLRCQDVAEFAGMDMSNAYRQSWEVARKLRGRELLLWKPELDRVGACGFLRYVEYGAGRSGELDVVITDEIVPYIEKFIEERVLGFTKYELGVIASLKSFYSLRLYEICKSMNFGEFRKDGWELSVDDLRKRFGVLIVDSKGKTTVDSYGDWRRLREKVLDKAVKEVNEASDLRVSYKLRKDGREIVGVRFFIASNKAGAVVAGSEEPDRNLMQRMSKLGVSGKVMKDLFALYGTTDRSRLEYALRETEIAVKAGKAKRPAAYYVAAVKRDDRKQGELFSPQQKAKERQLEAAELAREAELRARRPSGPDKGALSIADVLKTLPDDALSENLKKLGERIAAKAVAK